MDRTVEETLCWKSTIITIIAIPKKQNNALFYIFLQQLASALLPDSLDHCFHFKVTPFSDFAGVLASSWLTVASEAAL